MLAAEFDTAGAVQARPPDLRRRRQQPGVPEHPVGRGGRGADAQPRVVDGGDGDDACTPFDRGLHRHARQGGLRLLQQHGQLADRELHRGLVLPGGRRERVEVGGHAAVVAGQLQPVEALVDVQVLQRLEHHRRAAGRRRVLDLEATLQRAGGARPGQHDQRGLRRRRRRRVIAQQVDQSSQRVPLRRGVDEAFVRVGVDVLGEHVGRARQHAHQFEHRVAGGRLVLLEQAALAAGRVLARLARVGIGGEAARQRGAQRLEVLDRSRVDVAEAPQAGPVPAREVAHPGLPPDRRSE
ncbi:MAG: hypothetical protein U1F50_12320 [Rubrivivax sp.]